MAAELCKVAMWVRTFVPGLPMYSLDHQIVSGNILLGVPSVDEAVDLLDPPETDKGQRTLAGAVIRESLDRANTHETIARRLNESDHDEIQAAAAARAEADNALDAARYLFDAALAVRLGYLRTDRKGRIPNTTDADSVVSLMRTDDHNDRAGLHGFEGTGPAGATPHTSPADVSRGLPPRPGRRCGIRMRGHQPALGKGHNRPRNMVGTASASKCGPNLWPSVEPASTPTKRPILSWPKSSTRTSNAQNISRRRCAERSLISDQATPTCTKRSAGPTPQLFERAARSRWCCHAPQCQTRACLNGAITCSKMRGGGRMTRSVMSVATIINHKGWAFDGVHNSYTVALVVWRSLCSPASTPASGPSTEFDGRYTISLVTARRPNPRQDSRGHL